MFQITTSKSDTKLQIHEDHTGCLFEVNLEAIRNRTIAVDVGHGEALLASVEVISFPDGGGLLTVFPKTETVLRYSQKTLDLMDAVRARLVDSSLARPDLTILRSRNSLVIQVKRIKNPRTYTIAPKSDDVLGIWVRDEFEEECRGTFVDSFTAAGALAQWALEEAAKAAQA